MTPTTALLVLGAWRRASSTPSWPHDPRPSGHVRAGVRPTDDVCGDGPETARENAPSPAREATGWRRKRVTPCGGRIVHHCSQVGSVSARVMVLPAGSWI